MLRFLWGNLVQQAFLWKCISVPGKKANDVFSRCQDQNGWWRLALSLSPEKSPVAQTAQEHLCFSNQRSHFHVLYPIITFVFFLKKINPAKLLEIEKSAFRHAPPKLDFTCSHNRTWCFSNRDFSSSRSYFCSLPLSFFDGTWQSTKG